MALPVLDINAFSDRDNTGVLVLDVVLVLVLDELVDCVADVFAF